MITITGNNVFDWIITVFIWIYVVSIIERVLDIGKAKAENLRLEYINAQSKKIDNTSQFFILVDYIIRHEICYYRFNPRCSETVRIYIHQLSSFRSHFKSRNM